MPAAYRCRVMGITQRAHNARRPGSGAVGENFGLPGNNVLGPAAASRVSYRHQRPHLRAPMASACRAAGPKYCVKWPASYVACIRCRVEQGATANRLAPDIAPVPRVARACVGNYTACASAMARLEPARAQRHGDEEACALKACASCGTWWAS